MLLSLTACFANVQNTVSTIQYVKKNRRNIKNSFLKTIVPLQQVILSHKSWKFLQHSRAGTFIVLLSAAKQRSCAALKRKNPNVKKSEQCSRSRVWRNTSTLFVHQSMARFDTSWQDLQKGKFGT